ncbi:yncE [Acrasis kona]|uniref:YncE n=1 Tax=Acrasis kona TaxID=1008807 RepID=A0AAW2YNH2_9EUKA
MKVKVFTLLLLFVALCSARKYFAFTTGYGDFSLFPALGELTNVTTGDIKPIGAIDVKDFGAVYSGECVYANNTNEYYVVSDAKESFIVNIYVMDASSGFLKRTITTGKVTHLETDETNHIIYAISYLDDEWHFAYLNDDNKLIPTIKLEDQDPMLGVSTYCQKCRKFFYASTMEGEFKLLGVDPLTMKITSKSTIPGYPTALTMDSSKGILYALLSDGQSTKVVQLDVKSGKVVRTVAADIPIGNDVYDTMYDPIVKTLFVSCKNLQQESRIASINIDSGKVTFSDEMYSTLQCLDQ